MHLPRERSVSYTHLDVYKRQVEGVSYGTPIGWNADFYNEIVCCPITYGQAMTILLLQEIRLL